MILGRRADRSILRQRLAWPRQVNGIVDELESSASPNLLY